MFDDIRFYAVILAIIGLLLGIFLGVTSLLVISIMLVVLGAIAIWLVFRDSTGSSGELGFFVIVGGIASILIPTWVIWLAKMYAPR